MAGGAHGVRQTPKGSREVGKETQLRPTNHGKGVAGADYRGMDRRFKGTHSAMC